MPDVHEPELVRLFDDFAANVAATAPGPDLRAVQTRARRRRRTRWSAIAITSLFALTVPTGVYALLGGAIPRAQPGAGPDGAGAASAIPSGSPTAAGLNVATDWRYVTLAIPANETGCAAGSARFAADTDEMGHGVAEVAGTRYRIGGGYNSETNPIVAYGDVDGDGAAEALLVISCLTPEGRRNPPSVVLLIGAESGPRTLGAAFSSRPRQPDGEGQDYVTKLEVGHDGTVIVGVRTFEGMGQCEYRLRWTGATFTGACGP